MEEHGYLYDLLRRAGLSDFQASTAEFLLVRPLKIALMVAAGLVIGRLGARAARRFVRTLHSRSLLRSGSPRARQRADTVGDVLANVVWASVWAVVVLLILGEVGVDLAPLIAGAGIVGVALGFGAQTLVRDFLSGLFIILEDQYGVGDVISVKEATGTVEDVSLRVTRLRATDGTVWFVPNGDVRSVGNSSMEWSRALVDVPVSRDADVGAVTRHLTEVGAQFAGEDQWSGALLEPPEVWGVQDMDADCLTVRVAVKTAPRQQFAVARELRARVNERLRQEGIRGGTRQAPPDGDQPRPAHELAGNTTPDASFDEPVPRPPPETDPPGGA